MLMRVLITGGAGFIGNHLCKRFLDEKAEVVCIDNFVTGSKENIKSLLPFKNYTLLEHDVVNKLSIAKIKRIGKPDIIIHLASPASPKHYYKFSLETALVNSIGTKNLLDLAVSAQSRFVLASTSEVYGSPKVNPQFEEYWGNVNPLGMRSCYDESKRFSEMLTMVYHRQFNLDTRIARIFNTYGPGMQPDDGRVISNFITQALTGNELLIYGSGCQTRSFCYVNDTVEGLYLLSQKKGLDGIVVNLGNPNEKTILEIANLIISLCNSSSKHRFTDLPQDDPEMRCPDISKAIKLLSWYPKIPLDQGLKETISYLKIHNCKT